jgi:hypothetical protein
LYAGPFLRAVGRAHAAVDIEHEPGPRPADLDAVDPAPGEVGQRRQILRGDQRAGLEATHLARGRGLLRHRPAADNPPHCGIASKALGVVHVLVPGEAAEHCLAELGKQCVTLVLPSARIVQQLGSQGRQAEGVVEFPERDQAGVRGDRGAVEFELQAAVKRDP